MPKYNTRYEYVTEKLADWLDDFANKQAGKTEENKKANYVDNILDIVNRNKKTSVEEKVAKYRELAGLDLVQNIEKEGEQNSRETVAKKQASHIALSIRDKIAQNKDEQMDKIKQYIDQVIKNRDGSIAAPAILEQLGNYLKIDKEWLRAHLEEIEHIIDIAKQQIVSHKQQIELPIEDLARTDDPKGDKEAPLFLPPASSAM